MYSLEIILKIIVNILNNNNNNCNDLFKVLDHEISIVNLFFGIFVVYMCSFPRCQKITPEFELSLFD